MIGWQLHQLDHMQMICTPLQTDNHDSTSPLSFFAGRMLFLPPNQQRQRTTGKRNSKGNQLPRLTWKMAVEIVRGVKNLIMNRLLPSDLRLTQAARRSWTT